MLQPNHHRGARCGGTPLHFMNLPIGRTPEGGLCIGMHQIEKTADIFALRPPGKN
jgi:hypothetical protein